MIGRPSAFALRALAVVLTAVRLCRYLRAALTAPTL